MPKGKMNSLKQVIVTAIVKVSEDPKYGAREYATSEDARRDFIMALIAELFPECPDCVLPGTPVPEQQADGGGPKAETLPERVAKRKATKEEKEAEKAAKEAEKKAKEEAKEAEKKAKEEAKAAKEKEKEKPAAPAKKRAAPKPKAEGAVNHPKKLNKTEENKVKKIAKELKVEGEGDVLAYLNGLTAEEYAAKTFDEHVRTFLTPKETAPVETVTKRGLLVEFKGKDYWVDPETKKIYATNGPVDEHVGHVGMLEFEEMEIPDHLPEDLAEIAN